MILYVKAGCPWCCVAEEYLNKHGYKYERIDLSVDPAAFTQIKRISGRACTPTLVIGDLVLPDFGLDELEDFLKMHNVLP